MNLPDDPHESTNDPVGSETFLSPPLASTLIEPPVPPVPPRTTAGKGTVVPATTDAATVAEPVGTTAPSADSDADGGSGGKLKAAAVIAGAAALANKVRGNASKKVHELREKSLQGRFVVVTEVNGLPVAVGPYRDTETAAARAQEFTGHATAMQLMTEDSFLGTDRTASPTH